MIISYLPLDIDSPHLNEVVDIYHSVYEGSDPEEIRERFLQHSTYPGHTGWVAVCDDRIVGFAYGFSSTSGQFYRNKLESVLEDNEIHSWLNDCFEFVEMAVLPEFRRQGIASTLEKRLLDKAPHQTSVLTTGSANEDARFLYEKLGWESVKEAQLIPAEDSMLIMGKKLNERVD